MNYEKRWKQLKDTIEFADAKRNVYDMYKIQELMEGYERNNTEPCPLKEALQSIKDIAMNDYDHDMRRIYNIAFKALDPELYAKCEKADQIMKSFGSSTDEEQ